MYPDEFRSSKKLNSLRTSFQLTDPNQVYSKIAQMTSEERYHYIRGANAEKQDLARRVNVAMRDLKKLKSENAKLKSEKAVVEDQLNRLRTSKSMRLGRALSSPARVSRRMVSNPKQESIRAGRQIKRNWAKLRTSLRKAGRVQSQRVKSEARGLSGHFLGEKKTPQQRKSSAPVELFTQAPTPEHFEKLLNHVWFVEGSISKAVALIQENPSLLDDMSDRGRQLAERILGIDRLDLNVLLPQRSMGSAYVMEHERVMYCVNQTPLFNSNGYSTRTRGVANGLKSSGKDVVVVGRSGYPWDSKADVAKPPVRRHSKKLDGIDYVHLPGGNLNRDPLDRYFMQAADAFVREARMQRPAYIQSASNFRTAVPALIAARRVGVPFIYEVRGLWELTEASAKPHFEDTERFAAMKKAETFVANEADLVFAITTQVKDELVDRGVDGAKIVVAPNAVDPDVFLPIPRDKQFAEQRGISLDAPVVGFAGSMVAYEGLDLLLDASARLHARNIDHQVVLAGSGAVEGELKKQADRLGIADKVRFLGRLPQKEMPRLQSTFDIVCCPRKSTTVTELVSPLKPLESFSTQKATILSDVAPNRDLAGESGSRAMLFESGNARALEHVLEKTIQDADIRADLGRHARLWSATERTWKSIGALMIGSYGLALENYSDKVVDSKQLRELQVGVIGDEFTRTTLEGSFRTELISRDSWRKQVETYRFDFIVIESAWEGNDGEWSRGVGYYSDEESADLRGLLELAREIGIPTLFWNKEDPVHFARFAPNAVLCDHIFTTDANMIPKYHSVKGGRSRTISALPFYAQPTIHNPLPKGREYSSSVAYAGSYYGERYAQRSKSLDLLLAAASEYPLDLYDRQANNPDSPYKFPEKYRSSVRGALPYQQIIDSYQAHLAHLNVNSVLDSPTMFSRRVVEIPACGGVVMSAFSRGISETLGSNIANSNRREDYEAWLHAWSTSNHERISEIWRQMRTVYRAHTTDTALTIMARTAGIPVAGMSSPRYIAVVSKATPTSVASVQAQSVPPVALVLKDASREAHEFATTIGIPVYSEIENVQVTADFQVFFDGVVERTFAEDVLLPQRFTQVDAVYTRSEAQFTDSDSIVDYVAGDEHCEFPLALLRQPKSGGDSLVVTLPAPDDEVSVSDGSLARRDSREGIQTCGLHGKKVLVAGHDLKFAKGLLEALDAAGAEVLLDEWESHTKHDEDRSLELLNKADIVFCEWGLGNAVWYSHKISDHQRLVVRVHSQELFRPYLGQIAHECVDKFIFVGELIRAAAVASHGVPKQRTIVIPNPVDTKSLDRPKYPESEKSIGFVGIVPRSKRLDLALDVLEQVLSEDPEYVLRIKGKTPEDYPWMKNRPEEMDYYGEQYARIDHLNRKYPGCVVFDGFGADMADWYSQVGVVLSTSDFESFHLTIADGAASGALPVCLNWPGADRIYPQSWLTPNTVSAAQRILRAKREPSAYKHAIDDFDEQIVLNKLLAQLEEPGGK